MTRTALILGAFAALVLPLASHAITVDPTIGTTLGFSNDVDLQGTVIKVVQWVLGLLSLVAVIMIIIGGINWMTAGGNEEKVEKAKKIISAAVIGLIIVLLAWAIIIFIGNTATNVT